MAFDRLDEKASLTKKWRLIYGTPKGRTPFFSESMLLKTLVVREMKANLEGPPKG